MLNEITQQFVQRFADDDDLAVRHVVGPRFFDDFKNPVSSGQTRGVQYQVIAYEEHMEDMYASVDLLIGRAGAGTIADVAATGTPSILIPWAGAADDHQTANAAWLTDSGAAIALKEGEVAESLIAKIEVKRRGDVRRAKLYYLRSRSGKSARIKEKLVYKNAPAAQ